MYRLSSAYFINRIVLIELQRIKQGLILGWILMRSAADGEDCSVKNNQKMFPLYIQQTESNLIRLYSEI